MVAEVYAGLSAFKAAFDIARGLKDINDATIRNSAIIELQDKILTAQAAQSELVDRVRELEDEVARLKNWEADKDNYRLVEVGPGAFAYVIKSEAQGSNPEYLICSTCFENGKRSVLQAIPGIGVLDGVRSCPACKTQVVFATNPGWKPSPERRW
jgi:hypothetical protein